MFTNLIESDSHRQEFKRRSSFFLATVAAYALILSAAGVASIYAYDAHLEAQSSDLEILNWVPPVTPVAPVVRPHDSPPIVTHSHNETATWAEIGLETKPWGGQTPEPRGDEEGAG